MILMCGSGYSGRTRLKFFCKNSREEDSNFLSG